MRGIKNHQRKDQIFIAILHTWTVACHMTLEIDINLKIKVCNSVFLPPWVRCVSTVALFFRFDGITMWYSAHKGSEGTSKVALILVDIYPIIILHENSPNWHLKYDNGKVQMSDDEKKIQNLWIEFDCRSIWVERGHPQRWDDPPTQLLTFGLISLH